VGAVGCLHMFCFISNKLKENNLKDRKAGLIASRHNIPGKGES